MAERDPLVRKILGVDPGDTSGWALVEYRPAIHHKDGVLTKIGKALTLLDSGQADTHHGWSDLIVQVDDIVYEEFRLYRNRAEVMIGNEFVPSQVIGVLKVFAEFAGVPVHSQPASDIHYRKRDKKTGKPTGPKLLTPVVRPAVDAMIPPAHKDRHRRDALAHIVYCLEHGALKEVFNDIELPPGIRRPTDG